MVTEIIQDLTAFTKSNEITSEQVLALESTKALMGATKIIKNLML